MIKNKCIFITGGAGFIGSNIVKRLHEDNDIAIYDNFERNAFGVEDINKYAKVAVGDIMDYETLSKAMRNFNPDIVIHAAAVCGIYTVIKDPIKTMNVNLVGTEKVLSAALEVHESKPLDRFINFSTSEIFGKISYRSEAPLRVDVGVIGEARWSYALSKMAGEHLTYAYHYQHGMPTTTVRPFNTYGPGMVGESAMLAFITQALKDADITVHGDGTQIRAWCYIDDFVDGIMAMLENPEAVGRVFNIGDARSVVTIHGLAQAVINALGSRSKIIFGDLPGPDVELRIPSVDHAAKVLNYNPKWALDQGIKATAAYFAEKA